LSVVQLSFDAGTLGVRERHQSRKVIQALAGIHGLISDQKRPPVDQIPRQNSSEPVKDPTASWLDHAVGDPVLLRHRLVLIALFHLHLTQSSGKSTQQQRLRAANQQCPAGKDVVAPGFPPPHARSGSTRERCAICNGTATRGYMAAARPASN